MRLFIAIELPGQTRERIGSYGEALRAKIPESGSMMRWVSPEQYHLTLKFLGECPDAKLAGIQQAVRQVTRDHSPFEIEFDGVGSFKSGVALKVLWLGVSTGKESLKVLANDLNRACTGLGFPNEKTHFRPHLTLARSKTLAPARMIEAVTREVPCPLFGPVSVERVALIQSALSPQGPRYTALTQFPMQP